MTSDRGLDATRAVRAKISREHGNDPRRLVEYYIRYQGRFANRLRPAPAPDRRRRRFRATPPGVAWRLATPDRQCSRQGWQAPG